MLDMEVAIVDACGGQFGNQHGSIEMYEVDQEMWEETRAAALPPEETLHELSQMEESGDATHLRTVAPGDVVTV